MFELEQIVAKAAVLKAEPAFAELAEVREALRALNLEKKIAQMDSAPTFHAETKKSSNTILALIALAVGGYLLYNYLQNQGGGGGGGGSIGLGGPGGGGTGIGETTAGDGSGPTGVPPPNTFAVTPIPYSQGFSAWTTKQYNSPQGIAYGGFLNPFNAGIIGDVFSGAVVTSAKTGTQLNPFNTAFVTPPAVSGSTGLVATQQANLMNRFLNSGNNYPRAGVYNYSNVPGFGNQNYVIGNNPTQTGVAVIGTAFGTKVQAQQVNIAQHVLNAYGGGYANSASVAAKAGSATGPSLRSTVFVKPPPGAQPSIIGSPVSPWANKLPIVNSRLAQPR